MGDSGNIKPHADAQAMIDAFASVGATHFVVSWTNIAGSPRRPRTLRKALRARACTLPVTPQNENWLDAVFIENISRAELAGTMPALLDAAIADQLNLIVRPYGPGVSFIQLDDIEANQLPKLTPAVFLALETSPGNYQGWLALPGSDDGDFASRVRKGAGADRTASGATRVAGSLNFKNKYAPNFPHVAIHQVSAGRITSAEDLDRLGLVAPQEVAVRPLPSPGRTRPGASIRKWPSYERCLDNAPPSQSSPGENRQSIADFTWCLIAADWGWPVEEIVARLMEESVKARENGQAYALKTAKRAAEAAARNQAQAAERRQRPAALHAFDYTRR